MPAPYGVTSTGFSTKTLAEALAEIEAAEQAVFGAGVIIDAQSPLGQLNGVFADAVAEIWETAQGLYGSVDIDQATGPRLDALAKLRLLTRATGTTDAEFRDEIRQDSFGTIKSRNLRSAMLDVSGVTDAWIMENSASTTAASGLPSHSLAIAVQGGADTDIATAIYNNTVPGIGLFGNTHITTTIDGFCRNVSFVRPVTVRTRVKIDVFVNVDRCECSPASVAEIRAALIESLTGACGVGPGSIITPADVVQAVAGVSGINVAGVQLARDDDAVADQSVAFTMFEIPEIALTDIDVQFTGSYDPSTVSGSTTGGSLGQGTINDNAAATDGTDTTTTTDTSTVSGLGQGTIS